MRWLRLLDRSRKRKYGSSKSSLSNPPASVVDPLKEVVATDLNVGLKPDFNSNSPFSQADRTKSGFETPDNGSIADKSMDNETSLVTNENQRGRPVSVSWYALTITLFTSGFCCIILSSYHEKAISAL